MKGHLPSCGQRREICKCASKLNKGIFLSPFKGLQYPFIKKSFLKTSSPFLPSHSLVLEIFFFAPEKN